MIRVPHTRFWGGRKSEIFGTSYLLSSLSMPLTRSMPRAHIPPAARACLFLLLAVFMLSLPRSADAFNEISVGYPDPSNVPARSVSDVELRLTAAESRTQDQVVFIPISLQNDHTYFPTPEDPTRYSVTTRQGSTTITHPVEAVTCSTATSGDPMGRCRLRVYLNSSISSGQLVDVVISRFRHPESAGSYRWNTYSWTDVSQPDNKHSSPPIQLVYGEVDRLWIGDDNRFSARPGESFTSDISFRVADEHGNFELDPVGAGREIVLTLEPIEADSGIRFADSSTVKTVSTTAESLVEVPEIVAGAAVGRAKLIASSPGLIDGEIELIAGNPVPTAVVAEATPKEIPNGPALGNGRAPVQIDITVLDGDGFPYTPADVAIDGYTRQSFTVRASKHDTGTTNFPECVAQAEGDGWSCELNVGAWTPINNEFSSGIDYVRDFKVEARLSKQPVGWDISLSSYAWVFQGLAPNIEVGTTEVFSTTDTTALVGGPEVHLGWSPSTMSVEYGRVDVDDQSTAPVSLDDPLATPDTHVGPVLINDLEPGTVYLYRFVVENINGKAYSHTRFFMTDPAPKPGQPGGGGGPGSGKPGSGGKGQPGSGMPGSATVRLHGLHVLGAPGAASTSRSGNRPIAFALFWANKKGLVRMQLKRRVVSRIGARRCRATRGRMVRRTGRCIRHVLIQRRQVHSRSGSNVIPLRAGRGARAVRPGRYRLRIAAKSGNQLVRTLVVNRRGQVRAVTNRRANAR